MCAPFWNRIGQIDSQKQLNKIGLAALFRKAAEQEN